MPFYDVKKIKILHIYSNKFLNFELVKWVFS